MAFGTTSSVFGAYLSEALNNDKPGALDADTFKAALYNDTITPDKTVAVGVLYAYNGALSQWVTAGEVIDTLNTNWVAGGRTITSPTATHSGSTFSFGVGVANTAGAGNVTITDARGCLVYNDTLAGKEGVCFNAFGGGQSVTNGTFSIVWNGSGIFSIGY